MTLDQRFEDLETCENDVEIHHLMELLEAAWELLPPIQRKMILLTTPIDHNFRF